MHAAFNAYHLTLIGRPPPKPAETVLAVDPRPHTHDTHVTA